MNTDPHHTEHGRCSHCREQLPEPVYVTDRRTVVPPHVCPEERPLCFPPHDDMEPVR